MAGRKIMEPIYKTVTEDIHIECESFESALEQVALLEDATEIGIAKTSWLDDDPETDDEAVERFTWTISASRRASESGQLVPDEPAAVTAE